MRDPFVDLQNCSLVISLGLPNLFDQRNSFVSDKINSSDADVNWRETRESRSGSVDWGDEMGREWVRLERGGGEVERSEEEESGCWEIAEERKKRVRNGSAPSAIEFEQTDWD